MIYELVLAGYPADCIETLESGGYVFVSAIETESIGIYLAHGNKDSYWADSKKAKIISCSLRRNEVVHENA